MTTPENSERQNLLNRREFLNSAGRFLLASALAPVALSACGKEPTQPVISNEALIEEFRSEFEIGPSTSREQFAAAATRIGLEHPDWMTNRRFQYQSILGKNVTVDTDQIGEAIYNEGRRKGDVAYPVPSNAAFPENPGFPNSARVYTSDNHHLVLYGVQPNLERLDVYGDVFRSFAAEYFRGIEATSVLHVIFLPHSQNVRLIDVDAMWPSEMRLPERKIAQTIYTLEADANKISRIDVEMSIPWVHSLVIDADSTPQRKLANVLSNEITNALVRQVLSSKNDTRHNVSEAASTVAGILAEIDSDAGQMILGGGAHVKFFNVIANEMARIARITG